MALFSDLVTFHTRIVKSFPLNLKLSTLRTPHNQICRHRDNSGLSSLNYASIHVIVLAFASLFCSGIVLETARESLQKTYTTPELAVHQISGLCQSQVWFMGIDSRDEKVSGASLRKTTFSRLRLSSSYHLTLPQLNGETYGNDCTTPDTT